MRNSEFGVRNGPTGRNHSEFRIPHSAFRDETDSASLGDYQFDLLALATIFAAVALVGGPGITTGGFGWSDAPNHVFDGVFILECVKNWPIANPREWAEQFYLHHPTLGIIVYWPPGFAAVEAVIFAILGVSIFAARLTILLFVVGAGWLLYALGKRWFDRPSGLFAALLLITCPHGFLWANDVMLEWPATFWILAIVYAYERGRRTLHPIWSFVLGIFLLMAYMTKQTAGFVIPVILLFALFDKSHGISARRFFVRLETALFLLPAGAIILAYHLFARRYTALPEQLLRPSFDPLFYIHSLPEIVGLPAIPILLLGLLTFVYGPNRGPRGLLLTWLVVWFGFCSLIAAKEPRYFFFALPPLMLAGVRFFIQSDDRPLSWSSDRPRLVLLAVLVVAQAALARWHDVGRLPRYNGAVAELAKRADADLVLVDALRDGQFVFDIFDSVRAQNRVIPLRASKILYARAARERYGYEQFVQSPGDIVRLLDEYGIRYIVIESAYPKTAYREADPPPRKMLRELLARDRRFELVKAWPLRCADAAWDDVELLLYEYPGCPPRTSNTIRLPIPSAGREITIQLP